MRLDLKNHWDHIYSTRQPWELSWNQKMPGISLDFIHDLNLPASVRIIDIGGGDSQLVDCLLAEGYRNITVLDISEQGISRARNRLGESGHSVTWIVSDIAQFHPTEKYDLWHDRATFHFLTEKTEIHQYLRIAGKCVRAYMVLGTFSESGPLKCSGLEIRRYSENDLQETLAEEFTKIRCRTEDHITPFNTRQNFIFCSFRKKQQKT